METSTSFSARRETVLHTPDLIAFWDFQSEDFAAAGPNEIALTAVRDAPGWDAGGVFGPRCLRFTAKGAEANGALRARAADAPALCVGGRDARVSVVAWLRREPTAYAGCQFVAGVWNEHGRRQYGMFLNLGIWDCGEQVGAHVSHHGGATPGFAYCMDAAIGATPVPFGAWQCAAVSYDGEHARAYLGGTLDARAPEGAAGGNPFFYPFGLLGGDADFTVGAVERPARVSARDDGTFREEGALLANPFVGCLGGLAVFGRALEADEMRTLAALLPVPANARGKHGPR